MVFAHDDKTLDGAATKQLCRLQLLARHLASPVLQSASSGNKYDAPCTQFDEQRPSTVQTAMCVIVLKLPIDNIT